jgi:hypothetical protein
VANACVFCGDASRRLTDEHVFGNWLSSAVPLSETERTDVRVRQDPSTRAFEVERRRIPLPASTTVVKVVCARCNNGWMSGMEARAGPILTNLATRTRMTVLRNGLDEVAAWASKTAMMREYMHPQVPAIDQDQRNWMRIHRSPPPMTQVWLGTCKYSGRIFSRHLTGGGHLGITLNEFHTHVTTFAFGQLFLLVVGTRQGSLGARLEGLPFDRTLPDFLVRIHPLGVERVTWPLPRTLSPMEVLALSETPAHWIIGPPRDGVLRPIHPHFWGE